MPGNHRPTGKGGIGTAKAVSPDRLNPYPAIVGYLIRVPIDDDQTGGHLLVEAEGSRDELGLGGGSGHETVVQASRSLEKSLDDVAPALRMVVERLRAITPGEFTVAFGLTVGTEGGVAVAKGGVGTHFTVTATWKPGESYPPATGAFVSHFRSRPDRPDPAPGSQR